MNKKDVKLILNELKKIENKIDNTKKMRILNEEVYENELKQLYVINYQYDRMKKSKFVGTYKRKENIIDRIEKNGLKLTNKILKEFLPVFIDWFEFHNINDMANMIDVWYNKSIKYSDIPEFQIHYLQKTARMYEKLEEILNDLHSDYSENELLKKMSFTPEFYDIKNEILSEYEVELEGFEYELADLKIELKNETDIDEIENISENIKEIINEINGLQQTIENIKETSIFEIFYESSINLNDYVILNEKTIKFLIDQIYIPEWENFIDDELDEYGSLEDTLDNVENIIHQMKKALKDKDLSKKFIVINKALNIAHLSGEFIDHIEEFHPEINKDLLDELSAMDIKDIDKKLNRLGFIF